MSLLQLVQAASASRLSTLPAIRLKPAYPGLVPRLGTCSHAALNRRYFRIDLVEAATIASLHGSSYI
jgi:hypothetical protein